MIAPIAPPAASLIDEVKSILSLVGDPVKAKNVIDQLKSQTEELQNLQIKVNDQMLLNKDAEEMLKKQSVVLDEKALELEQKENALNEKEILVQSKLSQIQEKELEQAKIFQEESKQLEEKQKILSEKLAEVSEKLNLAIVDKMKFEELKNQYEEKIKGLKAVMGA